MSDSQRKLEEGRKLTGRESDLGKISPTNLPIKECRVRECEGRVGFDDSSTLARGVQKNSDTSLARQRLE